VRTSVLYPSGLSRALLLATLVLAAWPAAAQETSSAQGAAPTGGATAAPATAEQAAAARAQRLRRFRYGNLAETELNGEQIRISYPDLLTDSQDHKAFETLAAGDAAAWVSGRAIKLMTPVSLSFGDVTVARGNHSPDYQGVYSLWPKRTSNGWSLVFNNEADIWGTQRDPAADAVEVPLEHSRYDEPTEKLTVEFLAVEPGVALRIAWGDHQFLARFEAAHP